MCVCVCVRACMNVCVCVCAILSVCLCAAASCDGGQMRCSPVQCVDHTAVCDGHTDCSNGLDEFCYDFTNGTAATLGTLNVDRKSTGHSLILSYIFPSSARCPISVSRRLVPSRVNKQREIIALHRQGTQQQRPESPMVTYCLKHNP